MATRKGSKSSQARATMAASRWSWCNPNETRWNILQPSYRPKILLRAVRIVWKDLHGNIWYSWGWIDFNPFHQEQHSPCEGSTAKVIRVVGDIIHQNIKIEQLVLSVTALLQNPILFLLWRLQLSHGLVLHWHNLQMGVNNRMALPKIEEAAGHVSISACLTYGKGIDEFYVFGAKKIPLMNISILSIYHNTTCTVVGKAFQGLHSWSFWKSTRLQDFNKIHRWKGPMSIVTACKFPKSQVKRSEHWEMWLLRQISWIRSFRPYFKYFKSKILKTPFPRNAVTVVVFFSKAGGFRLFYLAPLGPWGWEVSGSWRGNGSVPCTSMLSKTERNATLCGTCHQLKIQHVYSWPMLAPMLACLVPLQSILHKMNTKQLNSSCF